MKRKYPQDEIDRLMVCGIYVNPNDLNIFVRKKGRRHAWTLNLGNLWSWVIMCAIIAAVVLLNMLQ